MLTPSGDISKPRSSSYKGPSRSGTGAMAGTHPRLSSSATLSSGSMPEISADDISARTAALAESLSPGLSSQATEASGTIDTPSSETGPAAMDTTPEGAGGRATLSELTYQSLSGVEEYYPSPQERLRLQHQLGLPPASADQREAMQLAGAHSPMDVSKSEGLSPVDYSTDLAASVSLPPMDPTVSEESYPKSSVVSGGKSSGDSLKTLDEVSELKTSPALPSTGSSAECYPDSATRASMDSAGTLRDISDIEGSSGTIEHGSTSDEDTSTGIDSSKPSPTKRLRRQRRVKDSDFKDPGDTEHDDKDQDSDLSTAL